MGAQIGNMVGNTVSPVVSKVAQPILDPVFQVGEKLNDQLREKTGIDVAKTARQVSSVATTGTEAVNGISNIGIGDLTGKLGSMLQRRRKSPGVDPQTLLKPQPSFTPQSDEKVESASSLKQGKEKTPEISSLGKAQGAKLDDTGKKDTIPEVDKTNKTKLR